MTALPNAAELHRMARADGRPTAFSETRERLEQANDVVAAQRAALHDLIREAHKQGVGPAVLARWSGYDPTHTYEILNRREI